jgi:hypothetical protein
MTFALGRVAGCWVEYWPFLRSSNLSRGSGDWIGGVCGRRLDVLPEDEALDGRLGTPLEDAGGSCESVAPNTGRFRGIFRALLLVDVALKEVVLGEGVLAGSVCRDLFCQLLCRNPLAAEPASRAISRSRICS